ncbi:MAG: SURF1 family protein [Gammaproteobacteria bacterium]
MASRWTFSWPLTLLTAALIAGMCSLGVWQLGRADEKRERLEAFDTGSALQNVTLQAMPPRYSRAEVRGRYDDSRQIITDGFSIDKRAGYQVLTPFVVEGSDTVLMVNRGWRVWTGRRDNVQGLEADNVVRTLRGRVERFWQPGMVLGGGNAGESTNWPRIVVYPQHDEISTWMQQPVAVWQLLLDAEEDDGFVRQWKPGGLPPERHLGYAVQWFALAITLLVLYLIILFKRSNPSEERE